MRRRAARGFTLIELMIVVAIIAIVAAFAYHNYRNYGFRARRAEGREMLMRVASMQERFFTNFNRYGVVGDLGLTAPVKSEKGSYVITIVPGGAGQQTYQLTATPAGSQTGDLCGNLQLTNSGTKLPAPAPAHRNGACW